MNEDNQNLQGTIIKMLTNKRIDLEHNRTRYEAAINVLDRELVEVNDAIHAFMQAEVTEIEQIERRERNAVEARTKNIEMASAEPGKFVEADRLSRAARWKLRHENLMEEQKAENYRANGLVPDAPLDGDPERDFPIRNNVSDARVDSAKRAGE